MTKLHWTALAFTLIAASATCIHADIYMNSMKGSNNGSGGGPHPTSTPIATSTAKPAKLTAPMPSLTPLPAPLQSR